METTNLSGSYKPDPSNFSNYFRRIGEVTDVEISNIENGYGITIITKDIEIKGKVILTDENYKKVDASRMLAVFSWKYAYYGDFDKENKNLKLPHIQIFQPDNDNKSLYIYVSTKISKTTSIYGFKKM